MGEKEEVKERKQKHADRRDQPEKQEGHIRPLPAIARLDQDGACLLLPEVLLQIELLDDRLHVGLGFAAQGDPLAAGELLALTGADLVALDRYRLHAATEIVAGHVWHGD